MNYQYDHNQVETAWLNSWQDKGLFLDTAGQGLKTKSNRDKIYLLFAFAYPSGSGLHVGHVESKTALDILARYYRMLGKEVFFPVGWDAFGLPAENYAIKTGVHPVETTKNAINTFRRQIKRIGISYDWANEIATSHPGYYKWTQWIFLQLYKKGLAYKAPGTVNWCPSCQTVLANEQVVNGECERCGAEVIQKELAQWYFKITDYKDELIDGLAQVDWPKPTEEQQVNWIGRKTGIDIRYQVYNQGGQDVGQVVCFTTRPDTNFGATFVVLAPEHQLVKQILSKKIKVVPSISEEVQAYVTEAQSKTELERQQEGRKKSGVFTGLYAYNPLTKAQMPVWIADFVLAGFGTGAVVGVPGHDKRDFEFAQYVNQHVKDHQIEIKRVVVADDGDSSEITSLDQVQEDQGRMINSGFLNGKDIHVAIELMMDHIEAEGYGQRKTTYRLRDWLISRQRYWGAPIPIVYDPEGKPHPVKEEHLPWELPTDVEFKPTGESPLTNSREFKQRVEKLYGKGWRPEYDTMDTFVDSSWYFLRYTDARNTQEFASQEQLAKWLPVDFYMIGPEHIVLHLLYARFFTKFLRDEGYLCEVKQQATSEELQARKTTNKITKNIDQSSQLDPNDHTAHLEAGYWCVHEPFFKMRHQGMILGPDHRKMSKSKGNVIDPDIVIGEHGADALRMYEMFMGPIEADKPWNDRSVVGVRRFLDRVYALVHASSTIATKSQDLERKLHQTIKKVSQDIPNLKFNTAIAAMMEFVNEWETEHKQNQSGLDQAGVSSFIQILAPFAPFLAEELWQTVNTAPSSTKTEGFMSVHQTIWPKWQESLARDKATVYIVQVNGKVRDSFEVDFSTANDKDAVVSLAQNRHKIAKWLDQKTTRKIIWVPATQEKNGLINFVAS